MQRERHRAQHLDRRRQMVEGVTHPTGSEGKRRRPLLPRPRGAREEAGIGVLLLPGCELHGCNLSARRRLRLVERRWQQLVDELTPGWADIPRLASEHE